jgi:hypothetical protein
MLIVLVALVVIVVILTLIVNNLKILQDLHRHKRKEIINLWFKMIKDLHWNKCKE